MTSLRKDVSPHVRESKKVLDSGFNLVDSGFQVLINSGIRIPCQWNLVSGRSPDSLSCTKGFQNTQAKIRFPDFRLNRAKGGKSYSEV